MNFPYTIIIAAAAMMFVLFVFLVVWLSCYVRVGPNRVLIVSGRKVQRADGRIVGFRIIKGGGMFVFPMLDKAEVLSLEVLTIEMPKSKARTATGESVEADCVAQIKINGDDASIIAAAEHFLSKSEGEIKNIVRPVLEKHLRMILGASSLEELTQNPGACADQVQAAASVDLANMGLSVISFSIQKPDAG